RIREENTVFDHAELTALQTDEKPAIGSEGHRGRILQTVGDDRLGETCRQRRREKRTGTDKNDAQRGAERETSCERHVGGSFDWRRRQQGSCPMSPARLAASRSS